jgi:hypothetical protein
VGLAVIWAVVYIVCPYRKICTAISETTFVVCGYYLHLISLWSWPHTHTHDILTLKHIFGAGRIKQIVFPSLKEPVFYFTYIKVWYFIYEYSNHTNFHKTGSTSCHHVVRNTFYYRGCYKVYEDCIVIAIMVLVHFLQRKEWRRN